MGVKVNKPLAPGQSDGGHAGKRNGPQFGGYLGVQWWVEQGSAVGCLAMGAGGFARPLAAGARSAWVASAPAVRSPAGVELLNAGNLLLCEGDLVASRLILEIEPVLVLLCLTQRRPLERLFRGVARPIAGESWLYAKAKKSCRRKAWSSTTAPTLLMGLGGYSGLPD
ncbi:unnamed protein product [Euphydryas editha]|uniref:Uncharacterized protein n=1 Tax=Euphydryas editha TaxID=104508 RepID=A0AAU9UV07_EUPED|nr:unnamed protein product [Euphydryas editha]